ncbi:MAG: GIY-YIG nuclease family protein [Deltaproteobacteria bacterium]|nr:GIY-YIG nuclease family protein [Deltaproteobacteria bacterium]
MGYWVYILQSESTGGHYCGHTSNLVRRLKQHNDPDYRLSRTTKKIRGHWELVWSHECASRADAMRLEKAIKKRGIGRYLREGKSAESLPR